MVIKYSTHGLDGMNVDNEGAAAIMRVTAASTPSSAWDMNPHGAAIQ